MPESYRSNNAEQTFREAGRWLAKGQIKLPGRSGAAYLSSIAPGSWPLACKRPDQASRKVRCSLFEQHRSGKLAAGLQKANSSFPEGQVQPI
jgi:hypothetical protein